MSEIKVERWQIPMQLRNAWALLGLLILLGVSLLVFVVDEPQEEAPSIPMSLWPADQSAVAKSFTSVTDLEAFLDQSGMPWMPARGSVIPPLAVLSFPRDIGTLKDVVRKKSVFFRTLLPIVVAENHNISIQRRHILELMGEGVDALTPEERVWLQDVAAWYRVSEPMEDNVFWEKLLRRTDRIPAPLVLAQAANESAWGTSRFALQGNNLFGLWTFDESAGIIPKGRKEGEKHAVQSFATIKDSVREYMRNLNTHRAYKNLRQLRSEFRRLGEPLQAEKLAQGLLPYSQRGEAYVAEIQAMIRGNQLAMLTDLALGDGAAGTLP